MIIYKFILDIADRQTIDLPENYQILSIQKQNDRMALWVLVDGLQEVHPVHFRIYGTGHEVKSGLEYISTVQIDNLVWHVFKEN